MRLCDCRLILDCADVEDNYVFVESVPLLCESCDLPLSIDEMQATTLVSPLGEGLTALSEVSGFRLTHSSSVNQQYGQFQ